MKTLVEPTADEPTCGGILRPLLLDYGVAVDGAPLLAGSAATFDVGRQITLVEGLPVAESPVCADLVATKSTYSTDGQDAIAVDEGADDTRPADA